MDAKEAKPALSEEELDTVAGGQYDPDFCPNSPDGKHHLAYVKIGPDLYIYQCVHCRPHSRPDT